MTVVAHAEVEHSCCQQDEIDRLRLVVAHQREALDALRARLTERDAWIAYLEAYLPDNVDITLRRELLAELELM